MNPGVIEMYVFFKGVFGIKRPGKKDTKMRKSPDKIFN